MSVRELNSDADLDEALNESFEHPILLLKHSVACGRSENALDVVLDHASESARAIPLKVITVQTHRGVSNAATKRLHVPHHTPQVLLIRSGQVLWHASHMAITADALDRAIEKAAQQASNQET
jgi:bacillithiol system protein YtxJ